MSLAARLNGPSTLASRSTPILSENANYRLKCCLEERRRREKKGDELAGASGIKKRNVAVEIFVSQLQKRSRWEGLEEAGLEASSIRHGSLAGDAFSSAEQR